MPAPGIYSINIHIVIRMDRIDFIRVILFCFVMPSFKCLHFNIKYATIVSKGKRARAIK